MGSVQPLTGGTPLKLRRIGSLIEGFAGAQEGLDVDAVIDPCAIGSAHGDRHLFLLPKVGRCPFGPGFLLIVGAPAVRLLKALALAAADGVVYKRVDDSASLRPAEQFLIFG